MSARGSHTIVLPSGSGCLELRVGESGWTQVVLIQSTQSVVLGAEMFSDLGRRLSAFLRESPSGLAWIFSLAELHSAAYGTAESDCWVIRFQDRDARWFAELTLQEADRGEWLARLEQR